MYGVGADAEAGADECTVAEGAVRADACCAADDTAGADADRAEDDGCKAKDTGRARKASFVRPRGEYVLVIDGRNPEELAQKKAAAWETMDIAAHVALYEQKGLGRKEAMKAAARDRGLSRRDIYQALLHSPENENKPE